MERTASGTARADHRRGGRTGQRDRVGVRPRGCRDRRSWAQLGGARRALLDPAVGRAYPVPADITDAEAVTVAVDHAAGLLGGLDTVVNAAAVDCDLGAGRRHARRELGRDASRSTSRGRSTSAVRRYRCSSRPAAARSSTSRRSRDCARGRSTPRTTPRRPASRCSRGRSPIEYGPRGIRANCLAPGVIDAGMTDSVTKPADRQELVAAAPARPHGERRGGRGSRRLALLGSVLHDRHDARRRRRLSRARLGSGPAETFANPCSRCLLTTCPCSGARPDPRGRRRRDRPPRSFSSSSRASASSSISTPRPGPSGSSKQPSTYSCGFVITSSVWWW